MLGEFDRVTQQVEHDLAQAQAIGDDRIGDTVIDRVDQQHPFPARSFGVQHCAIGDQVTQPDGLLRCGHLPGFDFRDVENVVEQQHHALARFLHQFGIAALFGREVAVEQQLDETQHAVHWGADLMAHIRKELRLRDSGPFGMAACAHEAAFEQFAFGHIAAGNDDRQRSAAIGIADERAIGLDIDRLAIVAVEQPAIGQSLVLAFTRQQATLDQCNVFFGIGMGQLVGHDAEEARSRASQNFLHGGRGIAACSVHLVSQHRV